MIERNLAAKKANKGVCLVDGSVGLYTNVIFGYSDATSKRGAPPISSTGEYCQYTIIRGLRSAKVTPLRANASHPFILLLYF